MTSGLKGDAATNSSRAPTSIESLSNVSLRHLVSSRGRQPQLTQQGLPHPAQKPKTGSM